MAYLHLLAGQTPGARERFDVRWRTSDGRMAQRFLPARRPRETARLISRLARRTDVYVGVALRQAWKGGGAAAIAHAHLLHVDLDRGAGPPEASGWLLGPLSSFALPTLEVASGGLGARHLYWLLQHPVAAPQLESANRRLALHLGGDLAAVDAARLLRPPSTMSFKYWPPRPVRLIAYRQHARYTLTELTGRLPADPQPPPPHTVSRPPRQARTAIDRQLLSIPAAEYVRVLAGLTPDRAGKLACPFHEDRVPSLQLYGDGSWFCFGCRRGGSVYDFAAALTGGGTRGVEFVKLREQLAATFAVESSAARGPARRR